MDKIIEELEAEFAQRQLERNAKRLLRAKFGSRWVNESIWWAVTPPPD